MDNKKKWYKTWWGIILLVLFWPFSLTYWVWKQKWQLWTRIVVIALIWIFFFAISNSTEKNKTSAVTVDTRCVGPDGKRIDLSPKACEEFNNKWKNKAQDTNIATPTTTIPTNTPKPVMAKNTLVPTKKPTSTPTKAPVPAKKPVTASKKITDKINNLVAEKYPDFEVTIWNKNRDFASEGQVPYEVVLNGSFSKTASSCDTAKKTAYYMLEAFYKDTEIRPTLSRVMITFPYYLRVSLGASDGVPMEKNGSFSGPTNFWNVMENMGLGENESGEMKNRTWGTYLTKCE